MSEPGQALVERITFFVLVFALFLISADSPRVGEEERRVWTPVVMALATMVVLARLPMLLRLDRRVLTSPPCLMFLAYLLWVTVCQFWSIDAAEGRNHVLLLWVVFLALLSSAEARPYETAVVYAAMTAGVIVMSWASLGAGLDWALSDTRYWRLKGVMTHEQTLALVCIAGLILMLVWMLNRRRCELDDYRRWVVPFLILAFATVVAAKARSFSVFCIITVMLVLFANARGNSKVGVAFALLSILGTMYVAIEFVLPIFQRSEQDATLSGRTVVWAMTWAEIQARPIHGFGFATYPGHFEKLWNNWFPAHAHNLWLQVWFENGLIGMILISAFLISLLRQGFQFQRQTGLLSYTLFLTVFLALASIMAVVIGAKITTPYGLLLMVAFQEGLLRHKALDHAQRFETVAARRRPARRPMHPAADKRPGAAAAG